MVGVAHKEEERNQTKPQHDGRDTKLHRSRWLTCTKTIPQNREERRQKNNEDRVNRLNPRGRSIHETPTQVQLLIRIHCHHRELLLINRPEHARSQEHRNKPQQTMAFSPIHQ